MKTLEFLLIFGFVSIGTLVKSQNDRLPNVDIYTLDGTRISASDIDSNIKPMVVFFWKTNDTKSIEQLSEMNEASTLNGGNVKIVGICTDTPGTMQSVKPFVYANNINFEIYIDKNNDLKRAMNVPETPATFLFGKDNNSYSMYMGNSDDVAQFITGNADQRLAKVTVRK
jgi:peroxiredoxin